MAPIDRAQRGTRLCVLAATLMCLAPPAVAQELPNPLKPSGVQRPPSLPQEPGPLGPDESLRPGYVRRPPAFGAGVFGPELPFGLRGLRPQPGQAVRAADGTVEPLPPYFVLPRGAVELTFTDNVAVANTNPQSDFIISPSAGFYAQAQTARIAARFDGSMSYDFYTKTSVFNGERFKGIGEFRSDLAGHWLSLDGRVATSLESESALDGSPATDRSFGRNQSQVLNYGLTPTARFRAGNMMNGEASYDFAEVHFLGSGAGAFREHTGTIRLENGTAFNEFGWEVNGKYVRREQDFYSTSERGGSLSLLYALRPNLKAVATGGYDDVDDPLLRGVSGLYATGGFRWAISRRSYLNTEAGLRYRKPYYNVDLFLQMVRFLAVRGRYMQGLATPQSVIADNLLGILHDPFLPTVGLPRGITNVPYTLEQISDPNFPKFGTTAVTFRRRLAEGGLELTFGPTTFSTMVAYERRRAPNDVKGDSATAGASLRRTFGPNLRMTLSAAYDRTAGYNFLPGVIAKTIQGRASADYLLGHRTALTLTYVHQRVEAFPVDSRENVGMLVLTRAF